ncbi:hypothetical protein KPH14_012486 [Odynerus spinipes]|uniref:Uncharacterized protein n=1 Tax=Odynerus spinipes TaxID=1348599 RepID=A0AAD9RIC2_9HYME|nr:hypothetical protein KPH14_012486 [Odynerus spinipes]
MRWRAYLSGKWGCTWAPERGPPIRPSDDTCTTLTLTSRASGKRGRATPVKTAVPGSIWRFSFFFILLKKIASFS